MSVRLVDAADAPGGRVRTDVVEGFRLDRGFQVLLTAYPELPLHFDMKALRLRPFVNGALVRHGGRFHRFVDPFRASLAESFSTAVDPVVTIGDKLRVARLRAAVKRGEPADLFRKPETTTRTFLEQYGFSSRMIERFFQPFFAGIFLERELVTSSRYFQFLFRMFSFGDVAVPENGMEALPRQMAVRLNSGTICTKFDVRSIRRERDTFIVDAGKSGIEEAKQVVFATDEATVRDVLPKEVSRARLRKEPVQWNRTTTFYYAAERSPVEGPVLVLNGEGTAAGPVNNAMVISQASERYAPPGMHLISASVVGRAPQSGVQIEQLERDVRTHLQKWFGSGVAQWGIVGGYPIANALPLCLRCEWQRSDPKIAEGIYVCGDFRESPSLQGALASGRRAAEAVLRSVS